MGEAQRTTVPLRVTAQGLEHLRVVFRESIERHESQIAHCERLGEQCDVLIDSGKIDDPTSVLHEALELLCDARRDDIAELETALAELDKASGGPRD
jgi:hypothetical protein